MKIKIEDIQKTISKIFSESKVFSIDTTYEKVNNSGDLKLIIFIHNIFYDKTNIIYTKLIFLTDFDKIFLTKNNFTYLYDINCEYKRIDFENINDFEDKIKRIFNEKKFGNEILSLSDFMKNPATLINTWLYDNDVKDKSVFGFKYEPKITIMPCKSLFFNFVFNLDDKMEITLIVTKENSSKYNLSFQYNDKSKKLQIDNLKELQSEIGMFIKEL